MKSKKKHLLDNRMSFSPEVAILTKKYFVDKMTILLQLLLLSKMISMTTSFWIVVVVVVVVVRI